MRNTLIKTAAVSIFIFFLTCGIDVRSIAQEPSSEKAVPEGVYIKLNREFYESLRNPNNTYSTDKSTEYLREISISTKFMVETNLQVIKQQERIIRLLEAIADKKSK